MKLHLPATLRQAVLLAVLGAFSTQYVQADPITERQIIGTNTFEVDNVTIDDNEILNPAETPAENPSGGAISSSGTLTFDGMGIVSFNRNTVIDEVENISACGGAVYAAGSISIQNIRNTVSFVNNVVNENNEVDNGYGGAVYAAQGIVFDANSGTITFSENQARGIVESAFGGAIYAGAVEEASVRFISNAASVTFDRNRANAGGGAIYAESGVDFSNNTGDITFTGNISGQMAGSAIYSGSYVRFTGNSGAVVFTGNESQTNGGTIHAAAGSDIEFADNAGSVTFRENIGVMGGSVMSALGAAGDTSSILIQNNTGDILFANNISHKGSRTYGGAIYANNGSIVISGNKSVVFSDNEVRPQAWVGIDKVMESTRYALGSGAIHTVDSSVLIEDNEYVEFRGNHFYSKIGVNPLTAGLCGLYSNSDVHLSAPTGGQIVFYDPLNVEGDVHFNEASTVTGNASGGNIVFSSANMEEDLDRVKGDFAVRDEEKDFSKVSSVFGDIHQHGGSVTVKADALVRTNSYYMEDLSQASLMFNSGTVNFRDDFRVGTDDSLRLEGKGTITGGDGSLFVFEDGAVINPAITPGMAGTAFLTVNAAAVSQAGNLIIKIDLLDSLVLQDYTLMVVNFGEAGGFVLDMDHVTVTGIESIKGSLEWKVPDDDVTTAKTGALIYHARDGICATYADEIVWNNGSGDRKWNTTSINWTGDGANCTSNCISSIVFGDIGSGTVTVEEDMYISSLTFNNSEQHDYVLEGVGRLRGNGTLTKQGNGSVTISTDNLFTGNTEITGGTLIVGHEHALGTGSISLTRGSLDMGGFALNNQLIANGGSIVNAGSFSGDMRLTGNVTIYGDATAGDVTFETGTLDVDGSLTANSLTINGGKIKLTPGEISLEGAFTIGGRVIVDLGTVERGDHEVLTAASYTGRLEDLLVNKADFAYSWYFDDGVLVLAVQASGSIILPSGGLWEDGVGGYEDGMTARFIAPGTTELSGDLRPESVDVNISGILTWTGDGSMVDGQLTKGGSGTLVIETENAYGGGTIINKGTISANADSALGIGEIALNKGTLKINTSDLSANELKAKDTSRLTSEEGGKLGGVSMETPGIVDSDGTLLFGGVLEVGGAVEMENLQIESGNTSGGAMVVNGGIAAQAGTVITDIKGTAALTKMGQGIASFMGSCEYTGDTSVQEGALVLGGPVINLPGHLRLHDGAKLVLRSHAGSTTETAAIAPRSTATFGSMTLSGGILDASELTSITVTGTLTLNQATTLLFPDSGFEIFFDSFVNASGLTLKEFFGYKSSGVTIREEEGRLVIMGLKTDIPVDAAVEDVPVLMLALAEEEKPAAPDQALAHATWGTARAAKLFTDTVRDQRQAQVASLDDQGSRSAWFSALSSFNRVGADGWLAGSDAEIYGGVVGLQFNGHNGTNVGLAIGQTWGHISPMGTSYVTQKTQHAAVYGTKSLYNKDADSAWVSAVAGYGTTDSDMTQDGHRFDWTQQSVSAGVRATASHAFAHGTSIYGFIGTSYVATNSGNTENGASGSVQDWQAEIGGGTQHRLGKNLTVYADASFAPSIIRHNPVAVSGDVRGDIANPGRLKLHVNAGASYRVNEHWNVNASYTYEGARRNHSHTANIGAACSF